MFQSALSHAAVIAFDLVILLRLDGLDMRDQDAPRVNIGQ